MCLWKVMSKDETSTTFLDVKEENTEHKLHKCKYLCLGLNTVCGSYAPIRNFPKSKAYSLVLSKELSRDYQQ